MSNCKIISITILTLYFCLTTIIGQSIDTSEYVAGDFNQNLCIASYYGYKSEVERLIKKGADVNCNCGEGVTPILYAIEKNNVDLVKIFLDKGAKINLRPYNGITPLHCAVMNGNFEIIDLLLDQGADIEIKDYNGATPLIYAIAMGQNNILRYLIEKGASMSVIDYMGNSPLIVATYVGNVDAVNILTTKEIDINAKNYYGFSALHIAILNAFDDIARILIQKGAKIDIRNNDNYTPLHLAVLNNDSYSIKLLLEEGASCKEKLYPSINSLELAYLFDYKEVANLLKSKNCKRNYLPYFNKFSFGYEYFTSNNDLFHTYSVLLSEMKFKYSILLGYGFRPFDLKVKESLNNNVYYYYEKRNFFNLGLNKYFEFPIRKNLNFILSTGLGLNYSYGSYAGTIYKPDDIFSLFYNFNLLIDFKFISLVAGYKYLDFKINESSKHWMNLGVYFNIGRKFKISKNYQIRWIDKLFLEY